MKKSTKLVCFLCVCVLFIFVFSGSVRADPIDENFDRDEFNDDFPINGESTGRWSGSGNDCHIDNRVQNTGAFSLHSKNGSTGSCYVTFTDSVLTTMEFEYAYEFAAPEKSIMTITVATNTTIQLAFNNPNEGDIRASYSNSGTHFNYAFGSTTEDIFHNIKIEADRPNREYVFYLDDVEVWRIYNHDDDFLINDFLWSASNAGGLNYNYIDDLIVFTWPSNYEIYMDFPFEHTEWAIYDYNGTDNFYYDKRIFCAVNGYGCQIKILYRIEDIGKSLYLLEDNETSIENAIDSVAGLPDQFNLEYYLTPTVRAVNTTDEYNIWLWDWDTATGTLFLGPTVVWRATSTYVIQEEPDVVFEWFRTKFPFNTISYILSTIRGKQTRPTGCGSTTLNINHVIPDEFAGNEGDKVLWNSQNIPDKIPAWGTITIWINRIMWLVAIIYIFIRIKIFNNR